MRKRRTRGSGMCTSVGALLLACPAGALAQANAGAPNAPTTSPSDGSADWRQRTEARLQQLEKENAELRGKVDRVADTQAAVMKDAQERGFLTLQAGVPRLTTPDFFDVNKYSAQGDFPGSIRLGGTNTSFQIGGYVQLDTIVDSDRIGNKDSFVISSIPT